MVSATLRSIPSQARGPSPPLASSSVPATGPSTLPRAPTVTDPRNGAAGAARSTGSDVPGPEPGPSICGGPVASVCAKTGLARTSSTRAAAFRPSVGEPFIRQDFLAGLLRGLHLRAVNGETDGHHQQQTHDPQQYFPTHSDSLISRIGPIELDGPTRAIL